MDYSIVWINFVKYVILNDKPCKMEVLKKKIIILIYNTDGNNNDSNLLVSILLIEDPVTHQ